MDRFTVVKLGGLFDELEKVAYGPRAISKVLAVTKRRALRPPIRSTLGRGGPSAAPSGIVENQLRGLRSYVQQAAGTPAHAQVKQMAHNTMKGARQLSGKMIMPRGGGGSVGFLRKRSPEIRNIPLTGKQRRATESIVRGHEMDELIAGRAGKASVMARFSHASPDVILRERNRVVTLPKDLKPAGDVLRTMRSSGSQGGEAGLLERATRGVSGKGIQYGEGQRLSRHARKRVTNLMEGQGLKEEKLRQELREKAKMIRGLRRGLR